MMAEGGVPTEIAAQIKPETEVKVKSVEKPTEATSKKEAEKPFDFKFYVTDHAPDWQDVGSPDKLKVLYTDVKKDGIESVRYDWRWKNIEPTQGTTDQQQIERYKGAVSTMKEVGLQEPTVALSSIPEWAKQLYKTDKNKFFDAYGQYLGTVKTGLKSVEGSKIQTVQVLNELNNPVYTPIEDPADLIKICEMTRAAFTDYNPDIKLMVSVLATTMPEGSKSAGFSENIRTFLPKLEQIKDAVDVIAIDYYPGAWQRPISEGNKYANALKRLVLPGKSAYKEMFSDMSLFKEVAEKVSSWGKDYELGETGFPVKGAYWGDERRQRYFYDAFFRNFKHLMVDFQNRGIKMPDRIGLYQAINEGPRNFMGKIMSKTPYPEFNWGMRNDDGERRAILRGSLHKENTEGEESRLSRIIHYMNAPMKEAQVIEKKQDADSLSEVRDELEDVEEQEDIKESMINMEEAKRILGKDFLGPDSLRQIEALFNGQITFPGEIEPLEITEKDLEIAKANGEQLIYRPGAWIVRGKEKPINFFDLNDLPNPIKSGSERAAGLFEKFANFFPNPGHNVSSEQRAGATRALLNSSSPYLFEELRAGWAFVKKDLLDSTVGVSEEEQAKKLSEYAQKVKDQGGSGEVQQRLVMETVWDLMVNYLINGDKLLKVGKNEITGSTMSTTGQSEKLAVNFGKGINVFEREDSKHSGICPQRKL
jgi:hypothetical protein